MRKARPGKECRVVTLVRQGKTDEARAYMKKNGLIQPFEGAPTDDFRPEAVLKDDSGVPVTAPPVAYVYPDFKPAREPLPEGRKYVRVLRELGHELQKIATFEEDDHLPPDKRRQILFWLTLREQADLKKRGIRIIGRTFAACENLEPRQGGWRTWLP